jgi:hypothetical protein
MKLKDLCNEMWDDLVALMDWVTLGKLYGQYTGCTHYEFLKAYLSFDTGFIAKLTKYFNLDMEDQDIKMFLPVGV